MPYLKVYSWEDNTYPEFMVIKLDREQQKKLITKLSRHFKTPMPTIGQSHGRGLNYVPFWKQINTHKISTMGNIIHEFAHHLNSIRYDESGHGKSFKKCLKRVYKWSVRYLPTKTIKLIEPNEQGYLDLNAPEGHLTNLENMAYFK
jgi:hypothetical protein